MATNLKEHKSQDKKITRRDFLKLAGVAGAVGARLPSLIRLVRSLVVVVPITIPILTRRQAIRVQQ